MANRLVLLFLWIMVFAWLGSGRPVLAGMLPTPTPTVTPIPLPQTGMTTEQLPRTGLPETAWALVGLAPLGFGLKRLSNFHKMDKENTSYLWKRREFLKK